ncbi:MAG: hypothetical protein GC152_15130 [Alphaproteobacteria bacterium]|nr:hypothetical protein [Alphaproteobacteria bacterium]
MIDQIVLAPIASTVLVAAFAATTAALAIAAAIRAGGARGAGAGALRLFAVAALVGLLLNPQWREAETTPLDDIVLILTDETASQSLDGRADAARDMLADLRERLEGLDDVEVIETAAAGEEETRLGAALAPALGAAPRGRLSAVFVITDGLSLDEIDSDAIPEEAALHVLFTGRENETDRKLTMTDAPRYGIVNQPVEVSFRVDDLGVDGAFAGASAAPVEVVLRVDGVEAVRQSVPTGASVRFQAPLDRPGETIIELEAASLDGEITTRNNSAVLRIQAVRDRLRVLLVSGEPHPGERVWRNLLKSDPAIDLVHFTILRPAEKQASDGVLDQRELALIEFPYDELFIEKLGEFDLVIFDRYTYRGVLNAFHFENIARYVERGGAVLVASGPELFGPLSLAARRNFAYILPVSPTGPAVEAPYRAVLTDAGARHPVTEDLPDPSRWGRWLRIQPSETRSGQTLMADAAGHPLLVLDRVQAGRVGAILSDHVWLWARGFDGGGPHAELLRRTAHWLMKEPELEEERLTLREAAGALVIRRRTLSETAPPSQVEMPGGGAVEVEMIELSPGRFEGRIEGAPRGLYRARSGELFAVGEVGLAAPPEFETVAMDRRALAAVADATGGGSFTPRSDRSPDLRRTAARADRNAGNDWAGVPRRSAARVDAVILSPVASPFVWLAAIAIALVGAWAIESGPRRRSAKTS